MLRLLSCLCALLLVTAFPALSVLKPVQNEAVAWGAGIGFPAPGFKLTNIKGEARSLAQYRGKVVLVNFWASWCPYCRDEMPSMDRLVKMFPKGDLVILAVNVERSIPDKYRRAPVSFEFLSDSLGQVQQRYGVSSLPDTFIVDRKGTIRQRVRGGIEWDQPNVVNYLKTL